MQAELLVHRKPAVHGATTEESACHARARRSYGQARTLISLISDACRACCCCAADVAMPSGDSICIVTQHPLPDRLELACRQCRVQIPASSVRRPSCCPGGFREVYVRAWIRLCCFMSEIPQCSLLTLKYVCQHRQYAYYGADQDTQAAPTVGSSGHLVHDDGWQE